jgi:hypothetical protein
MLLKLLIEVLLACFVFFNPLVLGNCHVSASIFLANEFSLYVNSNWIIVEYHGFSYAGIPLKDSVVFVVFAFCLYLHFFYLSGRQSPEIVF